MNVPFPVQQVCPKHLPWEVWKWGSKEGLLGLPDLLDTLRTLLNHFHHLRHDTWPPHRLFYSHTAASNSLMSLMDLLEYFLSELAWYDNSAIYDNFVIQVIKAHISDQSDKTISISRWRVVGIFQAKRHHWELIEAGACYKCQFLVILHQLGSANSQKLGQEWWKSGN